MAKKRVGALAFETSTTAAIVECFNYRFMNAAGEEDTEFISCDANIRFNGTATERQPMVTFARNATTNTKQSAVRTAVNYWLDYDEPGNSLSAANIQITGLPV